MLAKLVPKGSHTGCLLHHLVWPRGWVPTDSILRVRACNLLLEFDCSTSDVTSIPSRNLISHKLGCRDFVLFMRLLVAGFLVDDRKIYAFEVYRPVVGCIWGEIMTLDVFFLSSKSVVTYLNRYTQVSYKNVVK
jgi:hypothetical protein